MVSLSQRLFRLLRGSESDESNLVSEKFTIKGSKYKGTWPARCNYCQTVLIAVIYNAVVNSPEGSQDCNIYHEVATGICPKCGLERNCVQPIISEITYRIVVDCEALEQLTNIGQYSNVSLGYSLQNERKTNKELWIHNPGTGGG